MKSINRLLIASTLCFGLFYGCSQDQGQQGPQGPQGANGVQGNANVKPVKDSVNSSAGWTFNSSAWYAFFPNPYLSNAFINGGGFAEVFISTDAGATWTALPETYAGSTLNAQWTYAYTSTAAGTGVYIYFMWNDQQQHTDPYATYGSTAYFNVVCITPALVAKYPSANWTNYEALAHIPELKLPCNR